MNYIVSVMLVAGLLAVTLAPDAGPGASVAMRRPATNITETT